jgi:nitrogen fixation-related uncharacterized protein
LEQGKKMYYPYFITYMILGFAISLVVLYWCLKTGQFSDQQRARFLPLHDGPEPSGAQASRWNRYEAYGLLFLALAGLGASIAVVIFALRS